ncbi:MAG: methyltransferase [Candidatus Binatia bacterium]
MKPVHALNKLRELGLAFAASQAFITGCKIGIFDQLSSGPATPEELGKRLSVHPEGCRRLLITLKSLGLLEREQDRFSNSELGAMLTAKSPVPLSGLASIDPFYHMCEYTPDAVNEYGPVWQQALGATSQEVFVALYKDREALRRFCDYMNSYSVAIGQEIAERFDFSPFQCILDVAGGSGQLSQQIGLRYPHLRGIVMDLPAVLEVAAEQIAVNGLSDRFRTETADLFAGPYPSGADVLTLSWILHDWNDENCRSILRHCHNALPSGGVLLISESVMNPDYSGTTVWSELYSLLMLIACEPSARERTESEHRALLTAAGFRDDDVTLMRLEGPRDLIVARKA